MIRSLTDVIMLLSLLLVCSAQAIAQADALNLPQPQLKSMVHKLLHNDNAPCRQFESLTSDSSNLASYQGLLQKVVLKRQVDNSTGPTTSFQATTTASASRNPLVPVTTTNRMTSTIDRAPVVVTPTTTTSASTTTTTSAPASSSNIPPTTLQTTTTAVLITRSASQYVGVPVVTSITAVPTPSEASTTTGASQSSLTQTTAASSAMVVTSTLASSRGLVSTPISPSGVAAALRTSTSLVVITGANGPTTNTLSVLVWIATATATQAPANTIQPALQSGSIQAVQMRDSWALYVVSVIFASAMFITI